MKVTLRQAADFFRNNDNFTLLCHANPDGDTLGSGYALCGILHIMGKRARVICADEPSPRFDYLLDAINPDMLVVDENLGKIVTVDIADIELLGDLKEKYSAEGAIDFCIDHHISNRSFAKLTLLDVSAASCAELMWDLIKELGTAIPPGVAAAVYTGVSTDTGCFKYSNTTARTHIIAAELMSYGFDVARINYLMFEMKTRRRIELEQKAYAGIEYFFGGRCAAIALSIEMLEGVDSADTNNISILPKQVEGVEAGIIFKERKPKIGEINSEPTWKISVRTNRNINAQEICAALGGGGHMCAAGCKLEGSLEKVKGIVLAEIGKQMSPDEC